MKRINKFSELDPKKQKRLKRLRLFVGVTFALLFSLTLYIHLMNNNIKNIESTRDTRLDLYNETTTWVMQDMRAYLEINDNSSLQAAMSNIHMTPYLKGKLFSSKEYNASVYPHYSKVSFVDNQFSLKQGDTQNSTFEVYLLANVYHGNTSRQLNLLVFINNNSIYNVIAY